jgi:hypothetical protein
MEGREMRNEELKMRNEKGNTVPGCRPCICFRLSALGF